LLLLHRRPPYVVKYKLYPGFTSFRGILSLIQVYIFEIYTKFCVFWYPSWGVWKKICWPLSCANAIFLRPRQQLRLGLRYPFKLKGNGTSVAVLHLYDSFHQKCSKLGTYTTQDLKNNFYFRGFSISSGPEPRLSDEYHQFFWFFN
jgi:hypothetical protein